MTEREREPVYSLSSYTLLVLNLSAKVGWFVVAECDDGRVDIENIYSGETVGNLPRELLRGMVMRYTLTLSLNGLPTWAHDTVTAALDEHKVAWTHWGDGLLDVSGSDKQTVDLACSAALQRVGKRISDVVIDLFGAGGESVYDCDGTDTCDCVQHQRERGERG